VADPAAQADGRPDWTPPLGTNERIRNRAIWAVTLFAASVIPTIVGLSGIMGARDEFNIALVFALAFWLGGVLMALWAALPTLRYWEGLPAQTRWLGALPLLTISLFLSAALIAAAVA
jgi:hypothetical protein